MSEDLKNIKSAIKVIFFTIGLNAHALTHTHIQNKGDRRCAYIKNDKMPSHFFYESHVT